MKSRSFNSIRNTSFAFLAQAITSISVFITRTVFIYTLGNTYLGLNGLFSDILSLLSLAELGFGTAIIYSMYKLIAENDEKKISALLNLYGKMYRAIGIFVSILGLSLTPFLDFFISDMPDLMELPIIYILYLLNTSFSYFFVYKKSILIASQDVHITSIIQIIVITFQNIIQIITLLLFKNFLIYLGIQVICTILNNVCISVYVDKKYTYLKKYKKEKLDQSTKREITKNVISMFVSKISSVVVTSTDNILISKFSSTIMLGYYSNYTMFINLIKTAFDKFFESITGSVGNLLALETSEKAYDTYHKIWFVNFWLIGFSSILLFVMINPFIKIWIGESYLLSMPVVFFICLNLFMRLIRNTSLTYIETYGLFSSIKYKCIMEAIINFSSSIFYLKILDMGICGVLLGTFTSNILTNFWFEPYVIYKNKFDKSMIDYFIKFAKYLMATFVSGIISYFFCLVTNISNEIVNFVIDLIICCILINVIFSMLFYKSSEFKYLLEIVRKFKKKIFLKMANCLDRIV